MKPPLTSALPSTVLPPAAAARVDLEALIDRLEGSLGALGDALRLRDAVAIERHAQELHRSLEQAVNGFHQAARQGGLPAPLRHRLMHASGQVAAQRESLLRASAALDRAMDVLMPRDNAAATYGARGWSSN